MWNGYSTPGASSRATIMQYPSRTQVECRTCGKHVESVTGQVDPNADALLLTVRCHGAAERHSIPGSALKAGDYAASGVFPVVAFLRSVARHGAVSADARRERRMAR